MCALYNDTSRKSMIEWMNKYGALEAKHSVKIIGAWSVTSEHLTVLVFEAPTFEAMQGYAREPEVMNWSSWNTVEFKVAMALEY
jgi:hypothetical protein